MQAVDFVAVESVVKVSRTGDRANKRRLSREQAPVVVDQVGHVVQMETPRQDAVVVDVQVAILKDDGHHLPLLDEHRVGQAEDLGLHVAVAGFVVDADEQIVVGHIVHYGETAQPAVVVACAVVAVLHKQLRKVRRARLIQLWQVLDFDPKVECEVHLVVEFGKFTRFLDEGQLVPTVRQHHPLVFRLLAVHHREHRLLHRRRQVCEMRTTNGTAQQHRVFGNVLLKHHEQAVDEERKTHQANEGHRQHYYGLLLGQLHFDVAWVEFAHQAGCGGRGARVLCRCRGWLGGVFVHCESGGVSLVYRQDY